MSILNVLEGNNILKSYEKALGNNDVLIGRQKIKVEASYIRS